MLTRFVLATAIASAPFAAAAQDRQALYVRALAGNCAQCHGTDGHAAPGSTLPGLAGMPREYMLQQLLAFRDGSRPATVMHQIARGFSEPQLRALAGYFPAQGR